MTVLEPLSHQFTIIGGNLAFFLLLIASIQLYRIQKSQPTIVFLLGMLFVWAGMLTQRFAPMPDFTYIQEDGEIVGASGTFSQTWYLGSVIFYLGLSIAGVGLTWHAFRRRPTSKQDFE